jgi:hypothetical protein
MWDDKDLLIVLIRIEKIKVFYIIDHFLSPPSPLDYSLPHLTRDPLAYKKKPLKNFVFTSSSGAETHTLDGRHWARSSISLHHACDGSAQGRGHTHSPPGRSAHTLCCRPKTCIAAHPHAAKTSPGCRLKSSRKRTCNKTENIKLPVVTIPLHKFHAV